jgi:hypothetical protein
MAPASPNDTRPTRLGRIDLAMQKFCQGKKARVCTVADSLENLMIAAHVSAMGGGLNRSTQHFILEEKDGV